MGLRNASRRAASSYALAVCMKWLAPSVGSLPARTRKDSAPLMHASRSDAMPSTRWADAGVRPTSVSQLTLGIPAGAHQRVRSGSWTSNPQNRLLQANAADIPVQRSSGFTLARKPPTPHHIRRV